VWEAEALGALLAERVAQGLPQPAYGLSDEILTLYRNRRPPES